MGRRSSHTKQKLKNTDMHKMTSLVLDFLSFDVSQSYNEKAIIKHLKIKDKHSKIAVIQTLHALERTNKIKRNSDGRYYSCTERESITGVVDHVNPKFAFISTEEYEDDIWISSRDLNFACDKDVVKIIVTHPGRKDAKPMGKVSKIIKRHKDEFVGKIHILKRRCFVTLDGRKSYFDINIKPEDIHTAQHEDKVLIKITQWPYDRKKAYGEVIRILGKSGENEAEIHSIMAEFDLPFEFPNKIEKEATKLSDQITEEDLKERLDLRDTLTFTIDPADAKDFDDAISFKKLQEGKYELGVHIADVTHFVKPDTLLDDEAKKRATSVYLVDRTIPMLPEMLSNKLCSLRPKEDKFTFSVILELNDEGLVSKTRFAKTLIHSDRRFAYEEVQDILEKGEGEFAEELITINKIAKKIRQERFKRGSINLETTELRFRLDENGKPLEVIPRIRKDAHKLIEEYMLLANKYVAEQVCTWDNKGTHPFIYRVHDNPKPDRFLQFTEFASKYGYQIEQGNIATAMNSLLGKLHGKAEEGVLQNLMLRSMAKAIYTSEAKGHFGLAFAHYSHFTSPIRRYPDMMAHRLLHDYLTKKTVNIDKNLLEEDCKHCSLMERNATDAERASIKYKQVEFIQNSEKDIFDGIVVGINERGLFIEIADNKCEGMLRLSDIHDDYYDFDAKKIRALGRRKNKIINLGDKIKVKVKETNIEKRFIDFYLAEND